MSVSKLPSGKWRAQVYHQGRSVSAGSYATKREAKMAAEEKRRELSINPSMVTVRSFRERWLTDPLFARPKESTMLHNAERTRAFTQRYGELLMVDVGDAIVSEWLAGGKRASTVPVLRAMFNDAASAKGGRIVKANPFALLGIRKGPGNRYKDPPSEAMVWALIAKAREHSGPSFAAWLQVAAFTGMRPGELDALKWMSVDFERGRIRVAEQFNAATGTFTTPKNGRTRQALLTPPAREALLGLARESEFCFVNLQRHHWTGSARAYHFKAAKAAVGYGGTLYLATRHFAGSYMINTLGLTPEDAAIAMGHTDGGALMRRLYGHLDQDRALERVAGAYDRVGNVSRLRIVDDEE